MSSMIVDCSMAMAWLFHDEATPQSQALLLQLDTDIAIVPSLWFLEVTNVLALSERKKRITPMQSAEFTAILAKLQLEVDSASLDNAFDHILPLCRAHQLTSYDAVYLELAVRRNLPLATLDEPLRKAAQKAGVKLLGK